MCVEICSTGSFIATVCIPTQYSKLMSKTKTVINDTLNESRHKYKNGTDNTGLRQFTYAICMGNNW